MKKESEIENKRKSKIKKILIIVGMAAIFQSGLILQKEGKAMMREELDKEKFELKALSFKKDFNLLHNLIEEGNLSDDKLDNLIVSLNNFHPFNTPEIDLNTTLIKLKNTLQGNVFSCTNSYASNVLSFLEKLHPRLLDMNENSKCAMKHLLRDICRKCTY